MRLRVVCLRSWVWWNDMKQCIILLCYRGCCDETGCQVHNGYNELTYALFSRASEQRLSPNLCVSAESCERLRMVWDTGKSVGEITIPDLCEVWNWEGDTGVLADKWATTVQAAFLEGMTQSCTISWAEQRWVGCVSPASIGLLVGPPIPGHPGNSTPTSAEFMERFVSKPQFDAKGIWFITRRCGKHGGR
jgi:hypothetical protein